MPLRPCATPLDSADETKSFAALCDSFNDTDRPLGHSAEKSEEMNLKGSHASAKPPRWNIICQNRSLLSSLFFGGVLFVFLHFAGESVFVADLNISKKENMHLQTPAAKLVAWRASRGTYMHSYDIAPPPHTHTH